MENDIYKQRRDYVTLWHRNSLVEKQVLSAFNEIRLGRWNKTGFYTASEIMLVTRSFLRHLYYNTGREKLREKFKKIDSKELDCLTYDFKADRLGPRFYGSYSTISILDFPYTWALITDSEKERDICGRIILASKNLRYNVLFALNVEGANKKAHAQVIIDSGSPMYNRLFALIEGADVKAHEEVVLQSRDPHNNYAFARQVKGADIKAHEQVILESKIVKANIDFAENIPGADLLAHGRVIIESGNAKYIKDYDKMLERKLRHYHYVQDESQYFDCYDTLVTYRIESSQVLVSNTDKAQVRVRKPRADKN